MITHRIEVAPINAAPAAEPVEPLRVDGVWMFKVGDGKGGQVLAAIDFAEDGSFTIAPYTFGEGDDGRRTMYGDAIESGPNASARGLIEALTAMMK